MSRIGQTTQKSKRKSEVVRVIKAQEYEGMKVDAKVALIQELIPLGLMKVKEELQAEVNRLAGEPAIPQLSFLVRPKSESFSMVTSKHLS